MFSHRGFDHAVEELDTRRALAFIVKSASSLPRTRLLPGNVTCSATCDVDFPAKEGKKVMWFKNIHVDFTVGDMRIHLSNLFNGNKVLGGFCSSGP